MLIEEGFQLVPYTEDNPYTSDPVLPSLLRRTLPSRAFQDEIEPELKRFGEEVIPTIRALGAGNRISAPTLIQYDQWGNRIDDLRTSEGWRGLKAIAQKEGFPGMFYERKYKEHTRSYGFAKALLMVGDSHEIFCPMSMSDGAARVIELMGTPGMKKHLFPRLISRDPSFAFVSGQWMTERPGGSDVSQTETTAQWLGKSNGIGPHYFLDGFKWFSSATDSDIALALARTGTRQDGSRGLSLFLVPLRLPLLRNPSDPVPSSTSNGITIHRLKNKIGTHALPTAELSLNRTDAYLIGPLNQGVKNITPLLNITRIWSAIGSVGGLRKCLAIATAYANVRKIEGGRRLLRDTPLHVAQLASINLVYRALTHLTFGAIRLLGKVECNVASVEEQNRLRLLTPIVKAFAAEKTCAAREEAMTALGGAGYMEENEIGRLIRDCLVEKIWEGTTAVLALDLLRSTSNPTILKEFNSWAYSVVALCPPALTKRVQEQLQILQLRMDDLIAAHLHPVSPLVARPLLMLMGYIASSVYLLEHALWSFTRGEEDTELDIEVFKRWVEDGGFRSANEEVLRARENPQRTTLMSLEMVFGAKINTKM